MKTTKVYDLPTRLFHWLFAGLFIGAFFIGKVFDDESAIYPYHMLMGLTLALTVLFRIFWGFSGSRYARFSSFSLKPSELVTYFKNLFSSNTERKLGYNPASSWAVLIMMALALGMAGTGYWMTQGNNKEALKEIHELLGNAFIVVVIAHTAGVILHTIRHRDAIGASMVHGGKEPIAGAVGIEKSHTAVGLLFLAFVGMFVFHLNKNYDPNTRTLILLGNTLQLGELENEHEAGDKKHEDHDDDDDD